MKNKYPDKAVIGSRLRAARIAKGMSQMELSLAAGHHQQATIFKVEANQANIGLCAFKEICIALGVSADYLLGLSENDKIRENAMKEAKKSILVQLEKAI